MAVAGSNVLNNHANGSITSQATASHTPSNDTLYILTVIGYDTGNADRTPTATHAGGLTWVQVAHTHVSDAVNSRDLNITVFRAMKSSGLSAGTTTITYTTAQATLLWSIDQFSGIDITGTDGAGAVIQSATNAITTGTSIAVTLSAFGSASNGAFQANSHDIATSNEGTAPGSGWTELADMQDNGGAGFQALNGETEWRADNDTSADATWATSCNGAVAIAVEIAAAAAVVSLSLPPVASFEPPHPNRLHPASLTQILLRGRIYSPSPVSAAAIFSEDAIATESWARAALVYTRSFSDNAVASETWARAALVYVRSFSDSAIATETWARDVTKARTFSDNATATETWARAAVVTRSFSDSATATESWARVAVVTRTFSDAATATESWARAALVYTRSFSDNAIATESWARVGLFLRTFSDNAIATETWTRDVTKARSFSDSATATESWARSTATLRSFSDSAVATETWGRLAVYHRTFSDTATATESWVVVEYVLVPVPITPAQFFSGEAAVTKILFGFFAYDGTNLVGQLATSRETSTITHDITAAVMEQIDRMTILPRTLATRDDPRVFSGEFDIYRHHIKPYMLIPGASYAQQLFEFKCSRASQKPRSEGTYLECSFDEYIGQQLAQALPYHIGIATGENISAKVNEWLDLLGLTNRSVESSDVVASEPINFIPDRDTWGKAFARAHQMCGWWPPHGDWEGVYIGHTASNIDDATADIDYDQLDERLVWDTFDWDADQLSDANLYRVVNTAAGAFEIVGEYQIPDAAPGSMVSRGERVPRVREVPMPGIPDETNANVAAQAAYIADPNKHIVAAGQSTQRPHDAFWVTRIRGVNLLETRWTLPCTAGQTMGHSWNGTYEPQAA